jgi:hypothetical protein
MTGREFFEYIRFLFNNYGNSIRIWIDEDNWEEEVKERFPEIAEILIAAILGKCPCSPNYKDEDYADFYISGLANYLAFIYHIGVEFLNIKEIEVGFGSWDKYIYVLSMCVFDGDESYITINEVNDSLDS